MYNMQMLVLITNYECVQTQLNKIYGWQKDPTKMSTWGGEMYRKKDFFFTQQATVSWV